MKAASQHYCSTKTQNLKPASHVKLDAEFEARVSQASPQWQNARPKARVSVITAHVMRELTPIMEHFYGTLLPPETSINSPVSYGRWVKKNFGQKNFGCKP